MWNCHYQSTCGEFHELKLLTEQLDLWLLQRHLLECYGDTSCLSKLYKRQRNSIMHTTLSETKPFCLLSFTLTVMSIGFIKRVPAHISSTTTFSITGTKKTKECNLCLVLHCVCSLVHSVFMIGGKGKASI